MSRERAISLSSYWRTAKIRLGTGSGGLVGEKCSECGALIFPPRDICPGKGGKNCGHRLGPPPLPGESLAKPKTSA